MFAVINVTHEPVLKRSGIINTLTIWSRDWGGIILPTFTGAWQRWIFTVVIGNIGCTTWFQPKSILLIGTCRWPIGKSKHFFASNVCVLDWGELGGKSYLIKMARFSKFNLYLKLDNESYKSLPAFSVCELDKNTKFVNINHAQTFVDLQ